MPDQHRKYEEMPVWDRSFVEAALCDDDPEILLRAVICVSLYDEDWAYAQSLCIQLSSHSHFNVRGNAVLGFGHIARMHGRLDREAVQPIIESALQDESDYIRGHAHDAADDTAHFLGWKFARE